MEKEKLAQDGSAGYGEEDDVTSRVYTSETAPRDFQFKWKYLWGKTKYNRDTGFDHHVVRRIQMDKIASFSVTQMCVADEMSNQIRNLGELRDRRNVSITDCTACVGGNSVSFARYFESVTSIELDPNRFGMLKNNLSVCGEAVKAEGKFWAKEVDVRCGDCTKVCPTLPSQDVLFFDPPWGGVDYKKEHSVRLYLGSKSLSEICEDLRSKCTYVALKLPLNANVERITSRARVVVDRKFRKMWLLIVRYDKTSTNIKSDSSGNTKKRPRSDNSDANSNKAKIASGGSGDLERDTSSSSSSSAGVVASPQKRQKKSDSWIKAFSKRWNRWYWFNKETSASQWKDPTKQAAGGDGK